MKIIQINSTDFGGGVETVVRLHHEELLRQGHDVQLVVGRKTGDDPQTTAIPFRTGPKGFLRTARWAQRTLGLENLYSPSFRAVEEVFEFQPDVVHIHSLHGADSYAELAVVQRLARKYPLVITLHDFWLVTGHCGYPLDCQRWLQGCGRCPDLTRYPAIPRDATRFNFARKRRSLKKTAAHIITPSRWLKDQVVDSPILGDHEISVVENPIDSRIFSPAITAPHQPDSDRTPSIRDRHAIDGETTAVLMIANNLANVYKGMADGIAALNAVQNPRVTAVLVGNNADAIVSQLQIPTVVLPYTRSRTELADYYRMADILLMPSRCETFGLVAAEAMACGTPVISFDAGALPEVIGSDETGIVVDRRSPEALAKEIDALAQDADRRETMSQAAVKRIRSRFGVTDHTRNVLEVYQGAIRTRA